MEQAEDAASLAPVPVFVDDTGRRRRLTSRIGRVLLVGFSAYIGLVLMGFARDPRLGALHLPTVGLPDLGLMIPPAPLVLGEQTTRAASADEIEVSTAGSSDEDLAALAPTSGPSVPSSSGASGPSTKPTGVAPAPGPTPGRPSAPGTSTTSTSTSTTTTTIARTNSPTTTPTTAPSTPPTTLPTTPGQGSVAAKGPDGSGPPGRTTEPPGQQRKTTTTTAG